MSICVMDNIMAKRPGRRERPRGTRTQNVEPYQGFGNNGNQWVHMIHQQQQRQLQMHQQQQEFMMQTMQ